MPARRMVESEKIDAEAEITAHLQRVGCATPEAYREWCHRNGLRDALRKGACERAREVTLYGRQGSQDALRAVRQLQRHPEEVLRALSRGQVPTISIQSRPYLQNVKTLFASLQNAGVRNAFLELLLHTHRITEFDRTEPVITRYGARVANTYAGGLLALARFYRLWKYTPKSWKPTSHNPRRQFRELARHLLCQYESPAFLESAFFRDDNEETREQQRWFFQVGNGKSLRSLSLPFALTKRMAHIALTQTPDDLTVTEGWRWVQVLGMGGGERLARAIVGTRMGEQFEEEPFWETVIRFFVDNPMLELSHIGPLVDYLRYERFTPRRADDVDRLPPGFTMKGRTPLALLARMEAWHRRLATMRFYGISHTQWEMSSLRGYHATEEDAESGETLIWMIEELTTSDSLIAEGSAMRHCIATYANACALRRMSVWSLTVRCSEQAIPERVMTIAVGRNQVIMEARGRCNALPSATIQDSAKCLNRRDAALLLQGRRIVRRWAATERIGLPDYLQ